MFGIEDDELIEGLERLRARLCCYTGDSCDCKFGASMRGEQTGCPEVRQAIIYLRGQFDDVVLLRQRLEASAVNDLAAIRRILDRTADERVL